MQMKYRGGGFGKSAQQSDHNLDVFFQPVSFAIVVTPAFQSDLRDSVSNLRTEAIS